VERISGFKKGECRFRGRVPPKLLKERRSEPHAKKKTDGVKTRTGKRFTLSEYGKGLMRECQIKAQVQKKKTSLAQGLFKKRIAVVPPRSQEGGRTCFVRKSRMKKKKRLKQNCDPG